MKKLSLALASLALITAPAQAHEEHWHHRDGGRGWIAPLIIGRIIGGVITDSRRPNETVITTVPTVPYPGYTVVTSYYYDPVRGQCEVRDTINYYGYLVDRQINCYGH